LTLLGIVGLLTLRYLIVIMTLKTVHSKAGLCFVDLSLFSRVLLRLVSLQFFEVFDFLLSALSLDLTFFTLLFSLSLVYLLFWLLNVDFPLLVRAFALILAISEVHVDVFILEVHGVAVAVLSSQQLFE